MPRNWTLPAVAALALTAAAGADDGNWPQWRGPDRTGLSAEKGLLKEWPKDGPTPLWKATGLGDGYSTPSVAGGRIFVLGTKGKDEYLFARSEKGGGPVWELKIGSVTGGYGAPKGTPTVDGSRVYAVSSDGNLICADAEKGSEVWKKNFKADFGGKAGGWAYTESPLVDGDALVCTPGGATATLVKLNKANGDVIWKAPVTGLTAGKREYNTAAYSSVVKATIGGVPQYVQFLSGGVVGVTVADGKFLWHYDQPANGTANCSTPLVKGDAVFAASAYGNGGGRADVAKDGDGFKADQKYFVKKIQNHHGGMVMVGDHVYGTGSGTLMCIDFKTGDIVWEDRSVGKGAVTYADGHLIVRGEDGGVALVEANPKEYVEKGRFAQPDRAKQKAWPHPVVAGGKLYIRDWDTLLCYDLKAK